MSKINFNKVNDISNSYKDAKKNEFIESTMDSTLLKKELDTLEKDIIHMAEMGYTVIHLDFESRETRGITEELKTYRFIKYNTDEAIKMVKSVVDENFKVRVYERYLDSTEGGRHAITISIAWGDGKDPKLKNSIKYKTGREAINYIWWVEVIAILLAIVFFNTFFKVFLLISTLVLVALYVETYMIGNR